MILQALKSYYDRLAADPESSIPRVGWEYKEIPFIIVLNPDGSLVSIEDTREGEGRQRTYRIVEAVNEAYSEVYPDHIRKHGQTAYVPSSSA